MHACIRVFTWMHVYVHIYAHVLWKPEDNLTCYSLGTIHLLKPEPLRSLELYSYSRLAR